jgi:hypothetical protein
MTDGKFRTLLAVLRRLPPVKQEIGCGELDESGWWAKFSLELEQPETWVVVQQFGHILNYNSICDRLPTIFMPVSPPPDMNGGPDKCLSWVIECHDPAFTPHMAALHLCDCLSELDIEAPDMDVMNHGGESDA